MTNRQVLQQRRERQKKQKRVTTVLIVSGVALILAAILIVATVQKRNFETSVKTAQGHTLGDPNAPVRIDAFSDFGCGHCANFAADKAPLLIQEYVETGLVYYVYHSVGNMLSAITPVVAEAAYCAGDQNRFWEFHDMVFENQVSLLSSPDIFLALKDYGANLGLDTTQFNQCLDNRDYRERVLQDGYDAEEAGINSTPSFLINDQLLVGNQPYEQFQALIDAELQK